MTTWVVNDTLVPVRGELECRLISFEGEVHRQATESVEISANASLRCLMERMTLMRSGDFYHARLIGPDGVIAENVFFFMNFKSVKMPPAQVSCEIVEKEGNRAVLRLSSNMFAHFVCVEPPAGLETEDRCFDILPGATREVVLRGDLTALDAMRIRWRNREGAN